MPSEKCRVFRQAFFGSFSTVSPYPIEERMCRSTHHHPMHHQCAQCDSDAALADRRSAHNAVERQRREHLNTKFQELAHALPTLQNIRRPSKTMIVVKSLEFVAESIHRESKYRSEIQELRRMNETLRHQASSSMTQYLFLDDPALFMTNNTSFYTSSSPPSMSASTTVSDTTSRLSLMQ